MTAPQTGRIFISYRRADSAGYAGRIYDRLAAHFGKDAIFMDVDTIEAGLDFVEVLENAVKSCDVLVALIGRQWLSIKDEMGKQRLENPQDFVRIEVAAALNRSIRVIPVLVDGTPMPNSNQLPGNLKALARRNAVPVNHYSFHNDANRLIDQLDLALKAAEDSKILKSKERKEKEAQIKRQAEIEILLSQVDIALDLQDWEFAKEKLEAVIILEPNHVQAQVKLAIAERKLREKEEEHLAEKKAKQEVIEKAEQERKERERLAQEEKARKEKEAAREKAEREAAEKAAQEKAEKEAKEKEEREAKERAAQREELEQSPEHRANKPFANFVSCPNCGEYNPRNRLLCVVCGHKLESNIASSNFNKRSQKMKHSKDSLKPSDNSSIKPQKTKASGPSFVVCPTCKEENSSRSLYCYNCGSKL